MIHYITVHQYRISIRHSSTFGAQRAWMTSSLENEELIEKRVFFSSLCYVVHRFPSDVKNFKIKEMLRSTLPRLAAVGRPRHQRLSDGWRVARPTARSYTTPSRSSGNDKLLFRQLFEHGSSTFTYLLADVTHPDKPALVRQSLLGVSSFEQQLGASIFVTIIVLIVLVFGNFCEQFMI